MGDSNGYGKYYFEKDTNSGKFVYTSRTNSGALYGFSLTDTAVQQVTAGYTTTVYPIIEVSDSSDLPNDAPEGTIGLVVSGL